MLQNFVSVYVPNTQGLSGALDPARRAEVVSYVAKQLAGAFGGATASEGIGYFVSEVTGELVTERVTIIKSYHGQDPSAALAVACDIAQWVKNTLEQESVSVETESGLEFI